MVNKRGVSAVVATILVVLITVAAAALLFSLIVPFVQNSLDSSTKCIPYRQHFTFEESQGYTCYDTEDQTGFSVRTSNSEGVEEVIGFDVVFLASGSSKSISVREGDLSSSEEGKIRMLDPTIQTISVPKTGEVQTYVLNDGSASYSSIEIYPVLSSGKICDLTDSVKLISCRGVSL